MTQEKKYNIKDFSPIDDPDLIQDLNVLISDSYSTGYPQNVDFLTEFFVNYGVYTESYKSIFEKKKMMDKTAIIAPCLWLGDNSNLLKKDKPAYTLHINMTMLGQENPTVYREVSQALQEETFGYFFRQPDGRFIRPDQNNDQNAPENFYKFDKSIDDKGQMSDKLYTYTKELQFFSDKKTLYSDVQDMCFNGARFFQNLGLLDKEINKEDTFELANNIKLEMFSENRVAFGIDIKNIKPENFLITVGCGMGRKDFTEKTIKINMPKDFRSVLLKQGIRFE